MKIADVMTHRVISVTPDVSVTEAANLMLQAKISGLPVVDYSGKLTGIITEGDFLRRAEMGTTKRRPRWLEFFTSTGKLADKYVRSHGRKVSEVMSLDPHAVTEDTSLGEAVELMDRHRIKRLPVLRDGKPVGMVSRANLMQALLNLARPDSSLQAADWAIRDQILAELKKQPWAGLRPRARSRRRFAKSAATGNGAAICWYIARSAPDPPRRRPERFPTPGSLPFASLDPIPRVPTSGAILHYGNVAGR